jgi:hypothetical protein
MPRRPTSGLSPAAYRHGMQRPELGAEQRSTAARVAAMIDQYVTAGGDDEGARPALRRISDDPLVLGDVLGDYLHRVVTGTQADAVRYWPALEPLRAAGADEQRAAATATRLRHQHATGQAAAPATGD